MEMYCCKKEKKEGSMEHTTAAFLRHLAYAYLSSVHAAFNAILYYPTTPPAKPFCPNSSGMLVIL